MKNIEKYAMQKSVHVYKYIQFFMLSEVNMPSVRQNFSIWNDFEVSSLGSTLQSINLSIGMPEPNRLGAY